MRGIPKSQLCSEKVVSACFRTGVRFPSPPPPLDTNFDTKLVSSFFIPLAKQAPKTPCKPLFLQFGSESPPAFTKRHVQPFSARRGVFCFSVCDLTILPCGFIFLHPVSLFRCRVSNFRCRFQITFSSENSCLLILFLIF